MKWRKVLLNTVAPITALFVALAISSVALLLIHKNPFTAFKSMIDYGLREDSLISIGNRAVPLFLSGLAVGIGFKMNLFNIGVEGQYILAALIAAAAGAAVNFPAPLEITFICLVAVCVGAFWAGIAGILKVTRGVHEVISTIMLNAIAGGIGAWLLLEHLAKPTTAADLTTSTPDLPDSANFPALVHKSATSPEDLTGFLIVAIFIGIAFYLLVWRTRFGYNLRASGTNFHAARVAGVNPGAMIVKTMLLSGGIAGLVGMPHLLSFSHAYSLDFPTGLGFTGIAVALVGRNNPVGIAVAAVLFGFIERSAQILDFNGIPKEIFLIMEGVIILTVVIAYELVRRFAERAEVKAAAEQTRRLAAERAEAGEPEEATV